MQKQSGAASGFVKGSFQQRKQTVGVRENTSAAINKIGTDLNKFTTKLLNWDDKNLLKLSFNLYESSASYVSIFQNRKNWYSTA